jgi:hypothetical protein
LQWRQRRAIYCLTGCSKPSSPSSAIFRAQAWTLVLNRPRIWGWGQKICINSPSRRCDLAGHYLGHCLGGVQEKLLSVAVCLPGTPQISLAAGLSYIGSAIPFLGDSFLASPCNDVMEGSCPSWIPRWLQSDLKENGSEQRTQVLWRQRGHAFLLFSVNSLPQQRVSALQQK